MPWLVAAGLIRPVLSANLGMAGTRLLGPTISSTLSATAPLFGISFGLFILGETLTWPVAFGTAGIIAGVLILSSGRAASRDWPLYALAFPIAAAACLHYALEVQPLTVMTPCAHRPAPAPAAAEH